MTFLCGGTLSHTSISIILYNSININTQVDRFRTLSIQKYHHDFDWLLGIDSDEYVALPEAYQKKTLKHYIHDMKFSQYLIIAMPWVFMCSNQGSSTASALESSFFTLTS